MTECRLIIERTGGPGKGTRCRKPVVETLGGIAQCCDHADEYRRVNRLPPRIVP